MKEWVEAQAENGRYSNASDYVRDLIRRVQVKTEKIAAMQLKIDEGTASGVSDLMPEELFEKIRTGTLRPRKIEA